MKKTKNDVMEKLCDDKTLRIFRTVCDRSTHNILECLPEREYHIMAKSKLGFNELNKRLGKLREFGVIKKTGVDKYSITPLGKQVLISVRNLRPKVAKSIRKNLY